MTFKELVNKVRNLVLEAKNVTIEDTENKFTSENVEGALKECIDRADSAFQSADSGKELIATAIGSPATKDNTFAELASLIGDRKKFKMGNIQLTMEQKKANLEIDFEPEILIAFIGEIDYSRYNTATYYKEGVLLLEGRINSISFKILNENSIYSIVMNPPCNVSTAPLGVTWYAIK
ncbi:TPA: hypothetical protein SOK69_001644 [Clostridioides difficile]|nr:hypothetical protein [Clostridioides difficile]HEK9028374.1 hypothetical protein [Clostridioides difficile]